jgi:hypothetical protein
MTPGKFYSPVKQPSLFARRASTDQLPAEASAKAGSQRYAARTFEPRAPGMALSLFSAPSQAREMERREAPGVQRHTLAGHDAARRAVATARTPVT